MASISGRPRRRFVTAYGINLALNAAWSWTFFRARNLPAATAHAALITATAVDLIRRARPVAPKAAATLVPYAAWSGYATALATELARRNRGRLRHLTAVA